MDHSNLWDESIEKLTGLDFEKDVRVTLKALASFIKAENKRVIDVEHQSLLYKQCVYTSNLK